MASAPPATRAAVSRARRALEHVAHVGEAELLHGPRGRRGRGAGGAPRARPPRPATGSSALPSWRSRGWRPGARSGRRACGRGGRPAVTSAVSFSIFIRPPRPWPSWRRAMSPSIASWSSSSPAGRPSTMQVRPGPCDSPAVMRRSAIRPYRLRARTLARRHPRRRRATALRPGDTPREERRDVQHAACRRVAVRDALGPTAGGCRSRRPAGAGRTAASRRARCAHRRCSASAFEVVLVTSIFCRSSSYCVTRAVRSAPRRAARSSPSLSSIASHSELRRRAAALALRVHVGRDQEDGRLVALAHAQEDHDRRLALGSARGAAVVVRAQRRAGAAEAHVDRRHRVGLRRRLAWPGAPPDELPSEPCCGPPPLSAGRRLGRAACRRRRPSWTSAGRAAA